MVKNPTQADQHREKSVHDFRRFLLHAGFGKAEVAIQGPTEEGPDIIVTHKTEENATVRMIIQCKSSDQEGREYTALNELVRRYHSYVSQHGADIGLLALEGYTIPAKFKEKDTARQLKHKYKVVYWDGEMLEYYKDTVRTLGAPYSRYIILKDLLDLRIQLEEKPYVADALQIKQHRKGEKFWIFSIEPGKLLNTAYVFRRASMDPNAYQRMLKTGRLSEIGRFLSQKDSILANNLVVSFEEMVRFKGGKLYIPAKTCSVWIIDGQHRLYGFCRLKEYLDETERNNVLKNFKLIVTGVKSKHKLQASLFREINEFQKKIERNLLLDLYDYLEIDDDEKILLRIRIAKKLRKLPQFGSRIRILSTERGKITLATIVDYFRFREFVTRHGRKSYGILQKYFKSVESTFSKEWKNDKKYVLATNKGVRMLLSLLTRIIWYCENTNKRLDDRNIKSCLKTLKDAVKAETDYFSNKKYTGKALGAGSPDIFARDLWAARIDEKLGNFLSEKEKSKIVGVAEQLLEKLETKLRNCIETRLSSASKNWWKQRVPPDVRKQAEERKKKNEMVWPWYKGEKHPIVCYLDFSDYIKIMQEKITGPFSNQSLKMK